MTVLASLLVEAKVLLCSSSYTLLTDVAEAFLSLLFPFRWEHTYVPVLPHHMLNFIHMPIPFFMGVGASELDCVGVPQEVVLVFLDKNMVLHPQTLPPLPQQALALLERRIEALALSRFLPSVDLSSYGSLRPATAVNFDPNFRYIYGVPVGSSTDTAPPPLSPKGVVCDVMDTRADHCNYVTANSDDAQLDSLHRIRCAFAEFFGALMQDYRRCMGPAAKGSEMSYSFDKHAFLSARSSNRVSPVYSPYDDAGLL